jgi:hypothetical protein
VSAFIAVISAVTFSHLSDVRTFKSPTPGDFYDKEVIAAARDGSGAAYVSLTNFKGGVDLGEITLWRTHDAGDTYQGPVVVSPASATVLQQGSEPAGVRPGGRAGS